MSTATVAGVEVDARRWIRGPGDLPFTGTPANSRPVDLDDVVEVEALARRTNQVVQGPTPIRPDIGARPSSSAVEEKK